LEFAVVMIHQAFGCQLSECLGLIINHCQYLKQVVIFGM